MKKYGDLDMRKLREVCNLDFAHFTYLRGMCSCCYGPKDFPKRYWRNNTIIEDESITYILFKHATNGDGIRTKNDVIENVVYVGYRVRTKEQLLQICVELMHQLDNDYVVLVPKQMDCAVIICTTNKLKDYGNSFTLSNAIDYKQEYTVLTFNDALGL